MVWDKGWDNVFKKNKWGEYPNEELVRFIKSELKKKSSKEKKILEIGSGTGSNFLLYNNENLNAYGIDGSKVAINQAKKIIKNKYSKINLLLGDVEKLPFKSNFFDFVIDIECLYSNDEESTKKILKEVQRVLKHNGKFFSISFGTKTSGYKSGKKLNGERNTYIDTKKGALKKDYRLIRYMDKKDIKRIYKDFKIISIDQINRTTKNGLMQIQEWIIVCQKK